MRRALLLRCFVTVSILAAACGGTSTPSTSSGDSAAAASAKAIVDQYLALPKFVAPGASLDAKKISAGKTILVMPHASDIPYNADVAKATQQYGEKAGFKVINYPTKGVPDEWNRAIDLAITQHVAAIGLVAGLDIRGIIPKIQQAVAAGIPVVAGTWADTTQAVPTYVSASVPLDYHQAGILEAAYAIWKTNGVGHILDVSCTDCEPSAFVDAGQKETITKLCPKCTYTQITVAIPQWATDTQGKVQAALTADPSINYIIPNYDSQSTFVVAALNTLGKSGKIGIASFNGTPSILTLVQQGKVSMDVSEDVAWEGAAVIDAMLRILGHVDPSSGNIDEHIPLRVFDATNITETGSPPSFGAGFGTEHDQYLKLWGLS